MKGWSTARTDGRCAYDGRARWRAGDRIGVVQGIGWRKEFCQECFIARHGGGADTGEYLEDIQQAPNFPHGLTPASEIATSFDSRAAAARNDE